MNVRCGLALVSVAVLGVSTPLHACSYDGQPNNPFTESFPGALDIAFATSDAFDSKQLVAVEALTGPKGLRQVSWWLKLMAKQYAKPLESVTYIYLVDSHLWSTLSEENGIDVHTSPALDDRVSVLVLSEAALSALVHGEIDFDQALSLGIIQFANLG